MKKTVFLALAAFIVAVLQCCAGDAVKVPTSDSQLTPKMKVAKPTVIDLNATWCGPCRIFAPAFDKAAEKYAGKVDFYSVDTDRFGATAMAFSVSAIPTIVFISPDGTVKKCVGLNDFFAGLDINDNPSQAQVEEAIYNNLCSMVDKMLK